jgi:hypothetical protein
VLFSSVCVPQHFVDDITSHEALKGTRNGKKASAVDLEDVLLRSSRQLLTDLRAVEASRLALEDSERVAYSIGPENTTRW